MKTFNKPSGPYRGGRGRFIKREDEHKINQRITAQEVRLVGDNVENEVYAIEKAQELADELGLDLVEISPTAKPPVCKIIDYQKFLYEKKKKEKELKSRQAKSAVKEVRFGPNTDEHDFEFKLRHAQKFLKEGSKVKAYVHFKGRSIAYKEKGEIILLKFAEALADVSKVEQLPKLEGNRMFLFLAPVAQTKKK